MRHDLKRQDETLDSLVSGDKKLLQKIKGFRTSIDAFLLAGYTRRYARGSVLDLGTGNGILPVLLSESTAVSKITGIDMNYSLLEMANRSISLNGLQHKIRFVACDIRSVPEVFRKKPFDTIVSNPPYRKVHAGRISPYPEKAQSCHELNCTLDDVIQAAAKTIVDKGYFVLVFIPERLPELLEKLDRHRLVPKTLVMIHPFREKSCTHVIVCARKNVSPGLEVLPPHIIYKRHRVYTRETMRLYGSSETDR